MTLTVGSLFSGIGGFDLGLERAGMRVIWQSEIDPYASAVLRKHWPNVPNHGDIRSIRAGTAGRPDIICGGFPCQPFSHAGKRRGTDDDRHLWPEMCRVIGELRPAWVIGENVAGIISMELDAVLSDLEAAGYATRTFVIPAVAVDAPHRRDRVWIIAHDTRWHDADGDDGHQQSDNQIRARRHLAYAVRDRDRDNRGGLMADAYGERGCLWTTGSEDAEDARQSSGVGGAGRWLPEPDVGRVAHGIPSRVDRLRCLGNAIVPQIAEILGRAILKSEAAR